MKLENYIAPITLAALLYIAFAMGEKMAYRDLEMGLLSERITCSFMGDDQTKEK